MARDRQNYALQTIFSFFLGLMVLAFIVVGVITFYPSPDQTRNTEVEQLYRQQETIYSAADGKTLTAEQQDQVDEIQKKIDKLNRVNQDEQELWARNTSIVLIIFATLVMGISLIRSEQLRVISNGLLLGGLFTMVAGVIWVLTSGESVARFAVIVFAFAVTLGLGYVKFVRQREAVPVAATEGGGIALDTGATAELSARVDALERRAAAAAAALGATGFDARDKE